MKTVVKFLAPLILFLSFECVANTSLSTLLKSEHRSEQDKQADARRKPEKFMAFLEIKSGMQVLDVFSGGGYYSEISAAIVGEKGHVDAHNNQAYVAYIGEEKLSARYKDSRLSNATQLIQEANSLSLETQKYDRVLLVLSFHDLFYTDIKNGWPAIDAAAFMSKIKKSMKPSAIIGIIDHAALPNAEITTAQDLHRISPTIIKQKMQEWGFELQAEQDYLRNADDPKDIPMWDPKIRGKSDRVVMKFGLAR